jgi:uncharacterized protein with PQ loop repeat
MPLAAVVGWGGAVLGTLTSIAQLVRVRRRGGDGVNATTWSLFLLMSGFWLAYGVAVDAPPIVVASLAGAPFNVALLRRLAAPERRRGLSRAGVAVAATTVAPAALFGWNAGLLGIGLLVVATRAPQLVQLVRAQHADGVSVGSWLLGVASVALWLGYYVATARTAAAATMLAALACNLGIVALTVLRHRGVRTASRRTQPSLVLDPA